MEFEDFKDQLCEKLIDKYKNYCKKTYGDVRSDRTFDDYGSHLNTTSSYLEQVINLEKNKSFINFKALNAANKKIQFDKNDYIFLIGWYLYNGDKLYAMTIFDLMYKLIKEAKDALLIINKKVQVPNQNNDLLKKIQKRHSAFFYLQEFLILYDVKNQKIEIEPDKTIIDQADNYANEVRNKINKKDLHKLDGMDPLIAKLGIEGFIQLAIESSYFFSKELVEKQEIDLTKARHTKDKTINKKSKSKGTKDAPYEIDGVSYTVDIDIDNNKAVRSLIKEKTGLIAGEGKGSILQNTIISHVWGRAYDPRYFTSLWNIVLIPAWANSLMDKEDAAQGSLASKIRATYMAVCNKLYSEIDDVVIKGDKGKKLNIKELTKIQYEGDVIQDTYKLYLLNEKKDKAIQITIKDIDS